MFEDQYLGTVTIFAGNFAPMGWNYCDGSLQSIANNNALFSLLGTSFGGDGINTFGLPDLRGRCAIHVGQGPGLSPFIIGQQGGVEQTTINTSQMATHTHTVVSLTGSSQCSNTNGTTDIPTGNYPAIVNGAPPNYARDVTAKMGAGIVSTTTPIGGGSSQPFDTRSPYLAMSYIICMEGIYPSQP